MPIKIDKAAIPLAHCLIRVDKGPSETSFG